MANTTAEEGLINAEGRLQLCKSLVRVMTEVRNRPWSPGNYPERSQTHPLEWLVEYLEGYKDDLQTCVNEYHQELLTPKEFLAQIDSLAADVAPDPVPVLRQALELALFGLTRDVDNNGGKIDRLGIVDTIRAALGTLGSVPQPLAEISTRICRTHPDETYTSDIPCPACDK